MGKTLIGNIKGTPGADGVGIARVYSSTSAAANGKLVTIILTNGTRSEFFLTNGDDGADGAPGVEGAPATINGVNALTLEAKGGISATQSGDILTLAAAYPVGENILRNWYLVNPVNQRGFTEQIGLGGYFIDLWRGSTTSATTVSVGAEGLTIANASESNTSYIRQYFDAGRVPAGKYTVSILAENVIGSSVVTCRRRQAGTFTTTHEIVEGLTTFVVSADEELERLQFQISAGASLTIRAVKLELGDTQTLAHQDTEGNWLLNEIPDYGEELLKCQRYQYNPLSGGSDQIIGTAIAQSASQAIVSVPLPTTMRMQKPSFSVSAASAFELLRGGVYYPLTALTLLGTTGGTATLLATSGSALVSGESYFLIPSPDDVTKTMMIDANL